MASLSLAVQEQIGSGPDLNARGAWAIGTAYVANDAVTRSGLTYVNILANTGSDPATDAGVHWVVIGTGVTGGALTALSDAIISGFRAMVASRQSRRVGLLAAVTTAGALPCNVGVGELGEAWEENTEAKDYLNAAIANDQNLSAFRTVDPAVRAALTAPYTQAQLAAFGVLLIDGAADYAALTAESLPA